MYNLCIKANFTIYQLVTLERFFVTIPPPYKANWHSPKGGLIKQVSLYIFSLRNFMLKLLKSDALEWITSQAIMKRGMRLISRVRSISKWPPQWIYYDLRVYISNKRVRFTYIIW